MKNNETSMISKVLASKKFDDISDDFLFCSINVFSKRKPTTNLWEGEGRVLTVLPKKSDKLFWTY